MYMYNITMLFHLLTVFFVDFVFTLLFLSPSISDIVGSRPVGQLQLRGRSVTSPWPRHLPGPLLLLFSGQLGPLDERRPQFVGQL